MINVGRFVRTNAFKVMLSVGGILGSSCYELRKFLECSAPLARDESADDVIPTTKATDYPVNLFIVVSYL